MNDTRNAQNLAWPFVVALAVALVFYLRSYWVTGPAYLGDEIGYLSNAAFFGGHYVGGASSYYAGYSFLLAPLFRYLDDPSAVWHGLLILNAAMWGVSLGLVHWFVRRMFPQVSKGWVIFAVIVVAAYPPNVVMSGYAFSQSAVAFFYLLAVASLIWVDVRRPLTVIPHAVLVGLQFWIHPTGAVAVIASLLALLPVVLATRQYRTLLLHALVSIGLLLTYRYVIEPWRIAGMTPPGTQAGLHYPGLEKVAAVLLTPSAWKTLVANALGQVSYSAVATFGASVLGAIAIVRQAWSGRASEAGRAPWRMQVPLFVLLAPLGCIAITALSTASGVPSRLDHWVYGRYQDAFILPLMAYGLLCDRKRWLGIVVAASVCLVGYWLTHGVGASGFVNRVNLSGLWTEQFFQTGSIATWLCWGAVGILLFQLLPRQLAWTGALVLYALSIGSQMDWHRKLLTVHSNPSEIVEFVRGNFDKGCVYFDTDSIPKGESPVSPVGERGYLYSFYFYDYHYEKGKRAKDWVNSKCPGALLTYEPTWVNQVAGLSVVGMESQTGLRVLVKGDPSKLLYPVAGAGMASESYWISSMSQDCLQSAGCFHSQATDLARNTQMGELRDGALVNSHREGYLFFGPYRAMKAGTYIIRLRGHAKTLKRAYVDVVASRGQQVIMKEDLDDTKPGSLGAWSFELPNDVTDMEVRMWVGADDEVSVTGYVVSRADAKTPQVQH